MTHRASNWAKVLIEYKKWFGSLVVLIGVAGLIQLGWIDEDFIQSMADMVIKLVDTLKPGPPGG
jgi:di/tricarboxylate transporter